MNHTLRNKLLAMREKDVTTRQSLVDSGELDEVEYHPRMKAVHEENNQIVKEIISNSGWPLESEVGEDGSDAIWLLIQHAVLEPDFQKDCIELLKSAVEANEAKGYYLAYLHDRVLVQNNELQIYGTQHKVKDGKVFPLPTHDPENVNKRRFALDLWSQEEHTKHLQKDYDSIIKNREKSGGN